MQHKKLFLKFELHPLNGLEGSGAIKRKFNFLWCRPTEWVFIKAHAGVKMNNNLILNECVCLLIFNYLFYCKLITSLVNQSRLNLLS